MNRMFLGVRLLSLLLSTLVFWHYEGVWLYAHTRKQAARLSPTPANHIQGEDFDSVLSQLKEVISDGARQAKLKPGKGFADFSRLVELKAKLGAANEKIQQHFDQLKDSLTQKGFADEIINRHDQSAREYTSKYETLMAHLQEIESSHNAATGLVARLTGGNKSVDWDGVIGRSLKFLDANSSNPARLHFDPRNLPHRSLKADKPVLPKLTREEWLNAFAADSDAKVNSPAQPSSTNSKNSIEPLATVPPGPLDLAETIEVRFTPEIRQLADGLERNPVKIFNWVRNNIEFVPTWGSIQGAQLCLETRSCNAIDTASLLIALLRHSGVPARYQLGSIEVPIDKFKNWAGGFTDADAAASLFASGGVPSVIRRVNQSGQVVTVKLEHVWVKAFVDYSPSAGAVNLQGDTWVDLDAGFKQYSFDDGVNFESAVPSNSQTFINQIISNATIDPNTGSITSMNSAAIQPFSQQLANDRVSYRQTNLPNARLRELFGGKTTLTRTPIVLPGTISYRVLARAGGVSQIPNSLRHTLSITLGSNTQAPGSSDLWSHSASLPELAGKNLLLLYSPATPADGQIMRDSNTSAVPATVRVVPQLYLGSDLVATGAPVNLGSKVVLQLTFSSPTISTPIVTNDLLAGEAAAIAIDLQGISASQLDKLREKTENVKMRLQQNPSPGFSNRDFAEAFLSTIAIGWFATVDINNRLTSQNERIVTLRYPSAGLFLLKLKTNSVFGAATSVSMEGLNMDIDRDVVVSVAKDGDTMRTSRVNFAQGAFGSAMEAELPSHVLSTPTGPVTGIATAQALQLANDQGIPIYRINSSNATTVIPQLQISPDDLAIVQDAIAAGMEVTVSRTPVNVIGRSMLGIVIADSLTGSANFLISGGTNGALIAFVAGFMLLVLILGFVSGAFVLGLVLAAAIGMFFVASSMIRAILDNTDPSLPTLVIGMLALILVALAVIGGVVAAFALIALIAGAAVAALIATIYLTGALSSSVPASSIERSLVLLPYLRRKPFKKQIHTGQSFAIC